MKSQQKNEEWEKSFREGYESILPPSVVEESLNYWKNIIRQQRQEAVQSFVDDTVEFVNKNAVLNRTGHIVISDAEFSKFLRSKLNSK